MKTYLVIFSDGDELELEADNVKHDTGRVAFYQLGAEVGVFFAPALRGFVDVDALPEKEDDEDDDDDAF